MFGIVLSALNSVLGFVLRSVIVKFFVFFALFFITTEFVQVLGSSGLLPNASSLNGVLNGIPSAVWYFLEVFNFSTGFSALVSAWATRFIIRRIPVIG